MTLAKIRKIFKENELRHYQVFPRERRIVLTFDNDHTLSVEMEELSYEWDESVVVKIDGDLIARV